MNTLVLKEALGEFRILQYLSSPDGQSIYDNISQEICTVYLYQNIDEAVKLVRYFGQGCLLFEIDIRIIFTLALCIEKCCICIQMNTFMTKVCTMDQAILVPCSKVSGQLCTG